MRCPECRGKRTVKASNIGYPPPEGDLVQYQTCKGKGQIFDKHKKGSHKPLPKWRLGLN